MSAGPCAMQVPAGALPGCSIPVMGTKTHPGFSRQHSSTTVKRGSGMPVPDNIIVQM